MDPVLPESLLLLALCRPQYDGHLLLQVQSGSLGPAGPCRHSRHPLGPADAPGTAVARDALQEAQPDVLQRCALYSRRPADLLRPVFHLLLVGRPRHHGPRHLRHLRCHLCNAAGCHRLFRVQEKPQCRGPHCRLSGLLRQRRHGPDELCCRLVPQHGWLCPECRAERFSPLGH